MHNVFKGIVVGFIGFVIWFVTSVFAGIGAAVNATEDPLINAFMFIGFFIMVGGPVIYIVIIPIVNWWKRKKIVNNGD